MTYKLPVERAHRAAHGGSRPRRIVKGDYEGRILRITRRTINGVLRELRVHATRGVRDLRA